MDCPLAVDVLLHRHEAWRPTSTGRLIQRVMPGARSHVYSHDVPLNRDAILRPGRELWVLHPAGDAMPEEVSTEGIQVLLLDGNWREAARMRKAVEDWGRCVRLPAVGQSRYWLRNQAEAGCFSTAEALLVLLERLGLSAAARALRIQFELHVYAGLRLRGLIREAEEYLRESPLEEAMPEVLRELQRRRPGGTDGRDGSEGRKREAGEAGRDRRGKADEAGDEAGREGENGG